VSLPNVEAIQSGLVGLIVYVLIADFTVVIPTCFVGGLLLWRRQALGYVGGAGLLLMYSLLFAGLIPVMVFPAFYDASPMPVVDIVVILVCCAMCFIPFVLFVRGTARNQKSVFSI
jgi:hypothetical protein